MDATPLEQSLVALATAQCAATKVEVRWLGLDPARLAAGGRPTWDGDACRPHPELSLWWTTESGDATRFTVHPELVVWVAAKVAAAAALPGEPVTVADGIAPVDALVGGGWAGGAPIALQSVRAGDPLTATNVRARADSVSGSTVVLRVRSGSLEIRTEGRLLEDGFVGRRVRAYVQATRAVVTGVMTEPGTVDL